MGYGLILSIIQLMIKWNLNLLKGSIRGYSQSSLDQSKSSVESLLVAQVLRLYSEKTKFSLHDTFHGKDQ